MLRISLIFFMILLVSAGTAVNQSDSDDVSEMQTILRQAVGENTPSILNEYPRSYLLSECAMESHEIDLLLNWLEEGSVTQRYFSGFSGRNNLTPEQKIRLKKILCEYIQASDEKDLLSFDAASRSGGVLSLTELYSNLCPAPEEWKCIEAVWLRYLENINHFRYGIAAFRLFRLLHENKPDSPVIDALTAACAGPLYRQVKEEDEPDLQALRLPEIGAHLLMRCFYVDHHAWIWYGPADFSGYNRLPHADYLERFRDETFQYYWKRLKQYNDQMAAFMLGWYEDRRPLEDIKRAMLASEAFTTEHGWHNPMHVLGFGGPAHRGFTEAVKHINGGTYANAFALTRTETGHFQKCIENIPDSIKEEWGCFGIPEGRFAVSMLHAFAPDIALETICRVFRERGRKYRYLWSRVLPDVIPLNITGEEITRLLGEPDQKTVITLIESPCAAIADEWGICDTIWSWKTEIPYPDFFFKNEVTDEIKIAVCKNRNAGMYEFSDYSIFFRKS